MHEVIVVGGGPVGLLAACLLGEAGVPALLLEKEHTRERTSRAIGITPPTLEILSGIRLDREFIAAGVKVGRAVVHGSRRTLGTLDLSRIVGDYPFILSLPQWKTEALLTRRLNACGSVRRRSGHEVVSLVQDGEGVLVGVMTPEGRREFRSRYLFLCGGDNDQLRTLAGLACRPRRLLPTFLMADFPDRSGLGTAAHLFFTAAGAVESFPLPDGLRRWIVQTPQYSGGAGAELVATLVRERTGIVLEPETAVWKSAFGIKSGVGTFHKGRILALGDAAHVMPPIGGQGMNTGFADAAFAVRALLALRAGADRDIIFCRYGRLRERAARSADGRARLSLRIGAMRGRVASRLRNALIMLFLHSPLARLLPRRFGMLTIPARTPDASDVRDPVFRTVL